MTIPYDYQVDGKLLIQKFLGRALLADEMGLGKSFQFLMWMRDHLKKGPAVVICPATIKWNWQREAAMHCNIRAEVLETRRPPKGGLQLGSRILYIINYDILPYWLDWLKRLKPKLIGIDECQMIKTRSTKRTKAVKKLCKIVPHVIAMSGTPITNRPAELWTTLNILRPDLYPSFFPYAQRYCAPRRTFWGWEFKGATHLKELHRNLRREVMIRRLKKNVLDQLPDKSRHVVPMDIDHRGDYDLAEKEFLRWLLKHRGKRALTSAARAEKLVKMGYLKRLAGLLKLKQVTSWIDAFLQDTNGKLIVFGVHKKVLRPLHKHFGNLSVLVDGEVTGRKRQHSIDQFTHDKQCRILFGNVQAAGVGWNGTAASTVAFVEMAWTPGEHTQAEDRIHRIGQKEAAVIYYLVARKTIEEKLVKLIQEKQEVLDRTLDGSKNVTRFNVMDQLEALLLRKVT